LGFAIYKFVDWVMDPDQAAARTFVHIIFAGQILLSKMTDIRTSIVDMHMMMCASCTWRSEDKTTKVGCVLTDCKLIVNGAGYNAYHGGLNMDSTHRVGDQKSVCSASPSLSGFSLLGTVTRPPIYSTVRNEWLPPTDKTCLALSVDLPYAVIIMEGYDGDREEETQENGIRENYMVHAEMNALLHSNASRASHQEGCAFVSLVPCTKCLKHLKQAGYKDIVYADDNGKYPESWRQAAMTGINLIPYSILTGTDAFKIFSSILPPNNLKGKVLVSRGNWSDAPEKHRDSPALDMKHINFVYHRLFVYPKGDGDMNAKIKARLNSKTECVAQIDTRKMGPGAF